MAEVAGSRGEIIMDPRGISRIYFAWDFGIDSNNSAESYAIWQGLKVAKAMNVQSLTVIGDYKNNISHMVHNSETGDYSLGHLGIWIGANEKQIPFISISFYRVLCELKN